MTVIAGNTVGLLKRASAPSKTYILWAHEVNPSDPDKVIIKRYDHVNSTWKNLDNNNLFEGVLDVNLNTPPGSPSEGDAYVIGSSPTGAWVGHELQHALYLAGQWNYTSPNNGTMTVKSVGGTVEIYVFNGNPSPGSWVIYQTGSVTGTEDYMISFDSLGAMIVSDHLRKEGDNTLVKGILKLADAWISPYLGGLILARNGETDSTGWLAYTELSGSLGMDEYYFGVYDNLTNKVIKWGKDEGFDFTMEGIEELTANRLITWRNKDHIVASLDDLHGSSRDYFASEDLSSNNTTTYEDKINRTTPTDMIPGEYRFEWTAEGSQTNTADRIQVLVTVDGVTVANPQTEIGDVNDWDSMSGFYEFTHSDEEPINMVIQFRQQAGSTAQIRRARVSLYRLSNQS